MPSSMWEYFFPRRRTYFQALTDAGQQIAGEAVAVDLAFTNPTAACIHRERVHAAELAARTGLRSASHRNARMLVSPPIDPARISLLIARLDRLAKALGRTARHGSDLPPTKPRPAVKQFTQLLVGSTTEIEAALRALADRVSPVAHCMAVRTAEELCGHTWEQAVGQLFEEGESPLDVIRWKSLYDLLLRASIHCKKTADTISTIYAEGL